MCKDGSTDGVVLCEKVLYTVPKWKVCLHKDWFWERRDQHTHSKMCPEWILKAVKVSVFSGIPGKRQSLQLYYKAECPLPMSFLSSSLHQVVYVDLGCTSFLLMLSDYSRFSGLKQCNRSLWTKIKISEGMHSFLRKILSLAFFNF